MHNPHAFDGKVASLSFLHVGTSVGDRIEKLEKRFKTLHNQLMSQLEKNNSVDEVPDSLTLLPIKFKMIAARTINQLFHWLNLLFTFIDYSLLNYLISEFGDTELKDEMKLCTRVRGTEIHE